MAFLWDGAAIEQIPPKVAARLVEDAAMDDETKGAIALFRYGVLGPLVSARLEHGDRVAYFEAAAARLHVQPDGREVALSPRTIEAWFYAYARGGLDALRRGSTSCCRSPRTRRSSSGRRR